MFSPHCQSLGQDTHGVSQNRRVRLSCPTFIAPPANADTSLVHSLKHKSRILPVLHDGYKEQIPSLYYYYNLPAETFLSAHAILHV